MSVKKQRFGLSVSIWFLKFLRFFCAVSVVYGLSIVAAIYLTPFIVSSVAGATGTTMATPFTDAIVLWIFPSIFAVALLFVFTVKVLSYFYKTITHKFDAYIADRQAKLDSISKV